MEGNVRLRCPDCDTWIIVMPSQLFQAIGDLSGLEGEIQFREHLASDKAMTGDRLAVVDVDRVYACPECGKRGRLPPAEELFTD